MYYIRIGSVNQFQFPNVTRESEIFRCIVCGRFELFFYRQFPLYSQPPFLSFLWTTQLWPHFFDNIVPMKYGGNTQKTHEKKVIFSCLEGYNGLWIIPFPPFLQGNLPKNNHIIIFPKCKKWHKSFIFFTW